ncbi:MAG: tetratricopeptide repeat protein [Prevotella sp.]|jgi:tetratricopeptide (TPR) repeat protein
MVRKLLCILWLLVCMGTYVPAQTKKAISQGRALVKAGRKATKSDDRMSKFSQAEKSMLQLLTDSANRHDERIWNVLFESLRYQYEQGNEMLYLKQKFDTAQLFNIASRMFTQMEAYDSIDALPNKKGKVEPKLRKQNSEMLHTLRPNLYHGGLYFIRKQKYDDAYHLLDQYIDCAQQPLFASRNYSENDKHLPEAAYWAVYSAYKLKDVHRVLNHTYLALKDTAHTRSMLQYLSETYRLDSDTVRYVQTLRDGFEHYPLEPFFFSHLVDYYSESGQWENALTLTDEALKADSTSEVFWLTKSTVLLNMGEYRKSLAISKELISANDSLQDAYLNAGLALFNEGVTLDKADRNKARRKLSLSRYKEALPYLEKFRNFCPDCKDKWALPLYTIYLNLNMGKKFDEIDKLMKK